MSPSLIQLSHLDGEPEERLICATCVTRLREASAFRKQVLSCEEKLLKSLITFHDDGEPRNCQTEMLIKEEVPDKDEETNCADENGDISEEKLLTDTKDSSNIEMKRRGKRKLDDLEHLNARKQLWNKIQKTKEKLNEIEHNSEAQNCKTEMPIKEEVPDKDEETNCADENGDISEEELLTDTKDSSNIEMKRPGKRKLDDREHLNARKQLWKKIQKTKEKLNEIENSKSTNLPEISNEKVTDDDLLSFHNSVTIIENSFVCPFHTSYSYYSCVYCKIDYMDPEKLRDHSLKHNPTKFKTFFSRKPIHFDINKIDCRLCDEKINDIDIFKAHVMQIHGKIMHDVKDNILMFRLKNGPMSCTVCGKSFVFFHSLKRHMAEHSGLFVCHVCGSHFFDKLSLEMHNKRTHKKLEEISCVECGKHFKTKHNMLNHVSSVHKKQAAFQCSKCDVALFSRRDRFKHLLEVHGEPKDFCCGVCGKIYNNMKTLGEHKRTVHLKIFKHQCSICDRGFVLPSRLNEHIMSTHRGERSYHCETCGKSYPRLHYLKLHIQSHSL